MRDSIPVNFICGKKSLTDFETTNDVKRVQYTQTIITMQIIVVTFTHVQSVSKTNNRLKAKDKN